LAPLTLVIANYVLIPNLITESSNFMGFRLKSDRHKSNYIKHYISLVTNALLIPLFGLTSIETLYHYLTSTTAAAIEMKVLHTTSFFTRFLTGLCLFSNALNALDGPHWVRTRINKYIMSKQPAYMKLSPVKFTDTMYFDPGYQLAFVTVIWTIGIFFSAIAPIIPFICFGYFLIKYWIDKYNLMYVYPAEYDTQQPFTQTAGHFCTAAIFFFQIFMFVLFTLSFGDDFYIAAGVLLSIEIFGQILKIFDFSVFFAKFKDPNLVNDSEVAQKLKQAALIINKKFNSIVENGNISQNKKPSDVRMYRLLHKVIKKMQNPNNSDEDMQQIATTLSKISKLQLKEQDDRLLRKIDFALKNVNQTPGTKQDLTIKDGPLFALLRETLHYIY
jgi:hypothetical protein